MKPTVYCDGRNTAPYRMEARDHGIVFASGEGPDDCDILGAREAWVFQHEGMYHLTYDGSGRKGWLACIATSRDLLHWQRHGTILDFGEAGMPDSATATYATVSRHGDKWHMFYLGSPNATPAPDFIPSFPYLTLKAEADSPRGPWRKRYDITPWRPLPGSYYADTASPGRIIRHGGEYLQFFSSAMKGDFGRNRLEVKRSLGIARTRDLDGEWTLDPEPIFPLDDQVENSDLYYEPANDTWFLFTNHVGISTRSELPDTAAPQFGTRDTLEYTDAIWVYWTRDPNHWNPAHKAVVLDGANCSWAKRCIGLPAVIPKDGRLALLYDAAPGESVSHMRRHIGLAWLELPLTPPSG